jgi:hypothetical protein
MGSIQRVARPQPWLARYRAPDGRQHSKTFHRKVDAEKWLRAEEGAADRGAWWIHTRARSNIESGHSPR